jgi:hypothetical protein
MLFVEPYLDDLQQEWDSFVRRSRNGTFLFERDYMGYHAERFPDASMVVRDADGVAVALLPGTIVDGVYSSHLGLTYGGIILGESVGAPRAADVVAHLVTAVFDAGGDCFVYKPVPHIYHRGPAEEDLWALHCLGARMVTRSVASAIIRPYRAGLQERRTRGRRKAVAAGLRVQESSDWPAFWGLLEGTLKARHKARPVHSLQEIVQLSARFPHCIRLFLATRNEEPLAGTVVYETDTVARVQYIASGEQGRRTGALDLLFGHLIDHDFANTAVFDFGTSMDPSSGLLNDGNCAFKEGFGARTVLYDTYVLERGNWRCR